MTTTRLYSTYLSLVEELNLDLDIQSNLSGVIGKLRIRLPVA
ncbi:hypothetical protein H1P_740016 [Hyella patelloides LEGE 07179]|uniref:Uncharacterized protein n=1 Tax=Hyella patelloides LEGE 07179 TaxID=945734 RepID=A0A563W3P3_9CYAN|nr:hypothetical protein H1P_740016 [Hyella patelloides LEGE 07179]